MRRLLALSLATAVLTLALCSAALAHEPATAQAAVAGHGVTNHPAVVAGRSGSVGFGGSPLKPIVVLAGTLAAAGYAMRAMARGFDSLLDG